MASGASEIISWREAHGEIHVTNSGRQALKVVLVASLICEGASVCAEDQSSAISLRRGRDSFGREHVP